jgi:hypothetical protein
LCLQLADGFRRDEGITARIESEHRRVQVFQVGFDRRMAAVEDDARPDLRVFRRRVKR